MAAPPPNDGFNMTTVFILIAVGVVLMCAGMGFMCWRSKKDWKTIDLYEPLIEDARPRADEALEAAQRGTATCGKCGFANFAHVEICVVCGDAVGDEATRNKNRKRRKKITPLPAYAVRAARAGRRGEWARKTDVQDKIYWFRAPTGSSQASQAYTVKFTTSSPTSSSYVYNKTDSATVVPDLQIVWKEPSASTTDAIAFPVGPAVLLGAAQPLVALASEPFPARYAQFVERASALLPPQSRLRFRLKDTSSPRAVLEQAMSQLLRLSPADARCQLMIRLDTGTAFAGATESVDWHRDWVATIGEALAHEATGLFTCSNRAEQAFVINADSRAVLGERHLDYFFATGRLLGNALLHGDLLPFHLATPVLKVLLGQPLSVDDLQDVDPAVHKSLVTLLAMDSERDVEALALDFSVQEKTLEGHVVTVDLVPNGRSVAVTSGNKREYVARVVQRALVERVGEQLFALSSGLYEVVPPELLLLVVSAEELDYMLCGSDEIDVDEWEREAKYDQYLFDHPAKDFFWKVLRELPEDYKRRLLHYATGYTRVPLGGFAAMKTFDGRRAPFSLKSCELVDNELVKSQPCLNKLTLPLYVSKKALRAHMMAVLDPETYDAVIGK